MSMKLLGIIWLVFIVATAAFAVSAVPGSAAPDSPGVCNMFHVGDSAVGFAGMNSSSHGEGYDNMVDLVVASGCVP